MGAEERYGFRSTFFFAVVSRAEGHRLDVPYDLSTKRFRRTLHELLSGGWEVGLHISYDGGGNATRISWERDRLERISGCQVTGCRHHYWKMGRPFWGTLEDHGKAGLLYDSSIAFNEAAGYRLGIAYPYRPWSPVSRRSIPSVQIPVLAMDRAFFADTEQTAGSVLAKFKLLLDTLKKYQGVAALDWHEYTSCPGSRAFKKWGQAYLAILEMLGSDSDIAVKSGAQVAVEFDRCRGYN
jgi:hypothetical protein